ncbi:hypothetical protein FACS189472_17010 [Alphaproteobacteria bacterium]|nr:hypothetical protein FACS189472_17010 [Alphaproteobacteria bacterium]
MPYRPKTELLDKLITYRLVNFYNGKLLEQDLYVSDGKLYKKLKCGKYRPLKEQENFCGFKHYLLKNNDHKRTTVGSGKLDRLSYCSRDPIVKEQTIEEVLSQPD